MLRKKQEVFSQPRDNLGQAPSTPHLWIAARSNCLLADSTDSEAGDKTTNLSLFKAMSNFKIRKTMNNNSNSLPFTKVSLTLTSEAMDFLSETTNGTSHFAILGQLIKNTSVTPSSTSKRGNVITLNVGQVECSIHSYCAQFGIGRKKFEAIMRKMEQHGIIHMHRSRLATVADMTCITSWLLPDGKTMTNGTDGDPADHPNGQPDNHDATTHDNSHAHEGKADATSDLDSQSPADTNRSSAPEATAGVSPIAPSNPIGASCDNTPDHSVNRDYAVIMASDLFADLEYGESLKPHTDNKNLVPND